jgi:hypothetical protein
MSSHDPTKDRPDVILICGLKTYTCWRVALAKADSSSVGSSDRLVRFRPLLPGCLRSFEHRPSVHAHLTSCETVQITAISPIALHQQSQRINSHQWLARPPKRTLRPRR